MREIKFRYVWQCTIDNSYFDYSFYTLSKIESKDFEKESDVASTFRLVSRDQCTGMKDKNGKDIYEGDIVVLEEEDEDSSFGRVIIREPSVIVWKNIQWMFDNKKYKALGQRDWTDYATLSAMSSKCDFEIIGNIHKQPELLK